LTGWVGSPTINYMKKRLLIAIIPVAVLLAGPWVIPAVTQWSAINDHRAEINIKTGQARYSHRLWCVKVSEKVEDTVLSKVLGGETMDAANIEPWHTVYMSWPGQRIRRHYAFHGALAQAKTLEVIFGLLEPDAQRKQQIVRDVLKLWQTHGDYFEADRYLITLSKETAEEIEQRYPEFFPKTPSLDAVPAQSVIEKSENQ